MSETKYVYRILIKTSAANNKARGKCAYPDIHRCKLAILGVASLGKRFAQVRIQVGHQYASGPEILEEQEYKCELVEEVNAEYDAPEGWVRADEGTIAELNHRKE